MDHPTATPKGMLWTGRILKILVTIFMLFDSITKVIKNPMSMKGSLQMGISESCVQPIGIYLLLATILYIIPRTAVSGCLFLIAYLGAAAAIMIRAGMPGHPLIFPVLFAVIVVVAEYLVNANFRKVVPLCQ